MSNVLLNYFDDKTGTMQLWEGRPPVRDLISTGLIQCQAAGTSLGNISAGRKAYVVAILMHNTNVAAQTFTLSDSVGNVFSCTIAAGGSKEIVYEQPFLVLNEGALAGTAGTGDFVEVNMTYFEKRATQI